MQFVTQGSPFTVLHVINSLGVSGGAEQQLTENLHRFADPRFRHEVVFLYLDPDEANRIDSLGSIRVTRLCPDVATPSRLDVTRRLVRYVRETRPALIHGSLAEAGLASRVAGRLTGTPVVESLVNISHEPIRGIDNPGVKTWKLAAHRYMDRATMRWVSRFHALSKEVARSWVDVVGIDPEKIEIIPRGVSFEAITEAKMNDSERREARRTLDLEAEAFVFLHVGREEPQKGHRILLKAWPQVHRASAKAVLLMAGRHGISSPDIDRRMTTLGASVRRLGPRTDVYRLMALSDAFVFPSLYEGFGVSLLESMASQLPAVVFDRPPMNELIAHESTGLCARPFEADDLAVQMIRLIQEPAFAAEIARAAAEKAKRDHDPDAIARRIENLYAKILGGSRTGKA